ncbi:RNA polymerase sigma factor [Polaribacter batillariae]|uniref:RNA polymerase sigma factor n=1 Tax=Polaribacter batillariae TaxID=2808900 RepID=A0ABX7SSQ6_9FLAO|nr:RNA polymerase sigma factor [Polaribacter batillariae]QTD36473.1 RNA polymerase sigma factor [Polaribacter batillariae]
MKTKDFENKILSLSDQVYRMVYRMLQNHESSEDAVQEIMIKLWDKRKKIRNHPNIPGFVFLTARNYCFDLLKKKKPNFNSSEYQLKRVESDTNLHQIEWRELTENVKKILKELPPKQAEVMLLRDLDGFEFKEIAIITNQKIAHVRVLLSRARKQVGVQLTKIYNYEYPKI